MLGKVCAVDEWKTYLVPPVHRDQVTEPLVGKLVCHNVDNTILVFLIRSVFVEQDSGGTEYDLLAIRVRSHSKTTLPVSDQTPILHGTV